MTEFENDHLENDNVDNESGAAERVENIDDHIVRDSSVDFGAAESESQSESDIEPESGHESGKMMAAEEASTGRKSKGKSSSKSASSSKRGKKKAEAAAVASSNEIEWNEATADLSFLESGEANAGASANNASAAADTDTDQGLNHFEELARRVAETVSRKAKGAADMAAALMGDEPMDAEVVKQSANALDDSSRDENGSMETAAADAGFEGLADEVVNEEPSIAEMIAAELSESADGLSDTSSEIHAELLASALDSVGENNQTEESENADEAGLEVSEESETLGALEAIEAIEANDANEDFVQTESADANADQLALEADGVVESTRAGRSSEQMEFGALEEELGENDADAEPQEFIDSDQVVSIIESVLFSTDKPISIATIKQIFKGSNVRTKDITRSLDILASEYASSQRGVTLEEINGGYQLRTKSDNTEYLRRLAKSRPFRLSGPALEVLSIVAYKQPVSKHEVDEIRGVESGHLVRALMERSLICFNGKSENLPGKPMTYGTTRKFLETFGLRNLKELPTLSEIDEIIPEGIGEEVEKESLSDLTDRMSTELTSTYSEGEDELLKINEQLAKVDTTSEFFEQEKQRERERRDRERAQDIRERLVMGENVEEKDKKWLDRYEAKLLAQEQAAQAGVPVVVAPEDASGGEPAIGGDLIALTEEAQAAAQAAGTSDDEEDELDADTAALFSDKDMSDDLGDSTEDVTDWNEESDRESEL